MFRRSLCVFGVCLFVFSATPPASAQESGVLPLPLVEASAGYAFMRDTTMEENFPTGWYFSAATNLTQWFGLTGEISGAHKELTDIAPISVKANLYTFMAGPRFFIKRGRIVPFAEILAGAAHLRWKPTEPDATVTDTKFALQPGGGVTVLVTQNVSVRGAVDYRHIVFTDADEFDEDNSQVRAIVGVAFGWGTVSGR
jgi:opacity protein-like surface antigen